MHSLFEWLRELSFIESSAEGIFPHDLARETLATDLHWRNPDWYVELHNRARKYYIDRLRQTSGLAQQRLMLDTVFLHCDNAVIRSFFDWQTTGSMIPYTLEVGDVPALAQMVAQHEGTDSAELAKHWFQKYPQHVTVWRDTEANPLGFILSLPLHELNDDDSKIDPAVKGARRFLEKLAPLHESEVALLFRFWMAGDTYQGISLVDALQCLYEEIYGARMEKFKEAAYQRAMGMLYSDQWVNKGKPADSPLLAREEEALYLGYKALKEAINS